MRSVENKFQEGRICHFVFCSDTVSLVTQHQTRSCGLNQACDTGSRTWPGSGDEQLARLQLEMRSRSKSSRKLLVLFLDESTKLDRRGFYDCPNIVTW